jgi:hypothetical protein
MVALALSMLALASSRSDFVVKAQMAKPITTSARIPVMTIQVVVRESRAEEALTTRPFEVETCEPARTYRIAIVTWRSGRGRSVGPI